MKTGNLVKLRSARISLQKPTPAVPEEGEIGIVLCVDDSHRQTVADILFSTGLVKSIWENHLEVVDESR